MSFQGNNTIPPIYTAELMKQFFEKGQTEKLVRAKIADYQARHNGKYPAKIFVSTSMYLEIAKDIKCNLTSCTVKAAV